MGRARRFLRRAGSLSPTTGSLSPTICHPQVAHGAPAEPVRPSPPPTMRRRLRTAIESVEWSHGGGASNRARLPADNPSRTAPTTSSTAGLGPGSRRPRRSSRRSRRQGDGRLQGAQPGYQLPRSVQPCTPRSPRVTTLRTPPTDPVPDAKREEAEVRRSAPERLVVLAVEDLGVARGIVGRRVPLLTARAAPALTGPAHDVAIGGEAVTMSPHPAREHEETVAAPWAAASPPRRPR